MIAGGGRGDVPIYADIKCYGVLWEERVSLEGMKGDEKGIRGEERWVK